MKYTTLFQKPRLLVTVLALVCITLLGVSTWSLSIRSAEVNKPVDEPVQVNNLTRAGRRTKESFSPPAG